MTIIPILIIAAFLLGVALWNAYNQNHPPY